MPGFIVPTVEEVITSRRENSAYSELRFPDDLGPHAVVLNFSDYSYDRSANTVSTITTSSICLPLPQNLRDSFQIDIRKEDLGYLGDVTRKLVSAAGPSIQAGDWDGAAKAAWNSSALEEGAVGRALRAALAASDSAIVKGVESSLGAIINPHVALTFNGISLKSHQFNWTFAPTSASESVRLAKITRTIKASILPSFKKDATRTFLYYPKVVDIFFLGSEPGHMYFFKRCMVNSFDVDYAGAGTPAFLPNGRPGFVKMDMGLSEMEIHTAEDYTGAVK